MEFNIDVKSEAGINSLINAATISENGGVSRITESGAYIVIIKNMYGKKINTGSEFICFDVETEDGEIANFDILTISGKTGRSVYVKNGVEYPIPGVNQIRSGLMVCSRITNLKPVVITVNNTPIPTYKQLEGKKIGVVLEVTKREYKDKLYDNYELITFFEPESRKTGSELLKKLEATKVDRIVEGLKKNAQSNQGNTANNRNPQEGNPENGAYNEFFKGTTNDEEIPF
jgi:hypothetical protein